MAAVEQRPTMLMKQSSNLRQTPASVSWARVWKKIYPCPVSVLIQSTEKKEVSTRSLSVALGLLPPVMMRQGSKGVQTYTLWWCESYKGTRTHTFTPWKNFLFLSTSPHVAVTGSSHLDQTRRKCLRNAFEICSTGIRRISKQSLDSLSELTEPS